MSYENVSKACFIYNEYIYVSEILKNSCVVILYLKLYNEVLRHKELRSPVEGAGIRSLPSRLFSRLLGINTTSGLSLHAHTHCITIRITKEVSLCGCQSLT